VQRPPATTNEASGAGRRLGFELAAWSHARVHPVLAISLGAHVFGVRGRVDDGRDIKATGLWSGLSLGRRGALRRLAVMIPKKLQRVTHRRWSKSLSMRCWNSVMALCLQSQQWLALQRAMTAWGCVERRGPCLSTRRASRPLSPSRRSRRQNSSPGRPKNFPRFCTSASIPSPIRSRETAA